MFSTGTNSRKKGFLVISPLFLDYGRKIEILEKNVVLISGYF